MGIVNQAISFTIPISSGSTGFTLQDDLYDYRYYRIMVGGSQSDVVEMTLNGSHIHLSGTAMLDIGIYSINVTSAGTVLLSGVKTARMLFGETPETQSPPMWPN